MVARKRIQLSGKWWQISNSNKQNGSDKSATRIADLNNKSRISADGMETPKRSIRTNCRRRIRSDTFQDRPKCVGLNQTHFKRDPNYVVADVPTK
ncbi:hypothetical protein DPMN_149875 [Dreissena polymorpha]|uniref:Uncharacterized protein n=1 Tax=Dreissena polymorpha TaxID=45954 RepID=A0A9D4FEB8_DREPO|nr:hypothetical protein DPMN_149875 [Dreissena polymorpha]